MELKNVVQKTVLLISTPIRLDEIRSGARKPAGSLIHAIQVSRSKVLKPSRKMVEVKWPALVKEANESDAKPKRRGAKERVIVMTEVSDQYFAGRDTQRGGLDI